MILVIGGNSKIGASLLEQLATRGMQARAIARTEHSAEKLREYGVDVVLADLAHPSSLEPAMSGVERVFLISSPDPAQVELHGHAIRAAQQAGVRHFVRSSLLGADPHAEMSFARWHGECERELEKSGIPYTHLRPNYFLQNLLNFTSSVATSGLIASPGGVGRLSMVDTRDVASVAASVLTEEGHIGQGYDVTGPEAISYDDVAKTLSDILGKPVRYVEQSIDDLAAQLTSYGLPDWLVSAVQELYWDYYRSGTDGYAAAITDVVERIGHKRPTSVRMFLSEHSAAFSVQTHQS